LLTLFNIWNYGYYKHMQKMEQSPLESHVNPVFSEEDLRVNAPYSHGNIRKNIACAVALGPVGAEFTRDIYITRYCEIQGETKMSRGKEALQAYTAMQTTLLGLNALEWPTGEVPPDRENLWLRHEPEASKVLAWCGVELDFNTYSDAPLGPLFGMQGALPRGTGAYLRYKILEDLLSEEGQDALTKYERYNRLQLDCSPYTFEGTLKHLLRWGIIEREYIELGGPVKWRIAKPLIDSIGRLTASISSLKSDEGTKQQAERAKEIIADKALFKSLLIKNRNLTRWNIVAKMRAMSLAVSDKAD
jgi:hypothetical protein